MSSTTDDVEVLNTALSWLEAGIQIALVTVLKTWGSSPRPPGSLMVMNANGKYAGSVSGGCVEDELIRRFQSNRLAEHFPAFINYGVDVQQAGRLGLPCGGQLQLFIEEITDKNSLQTLLAEIEQGSLVARQVDIVSGKVTLLPGEPAQEIKQTDSSVVRTFGPAWQLFIVGNGQLASHLARMALQLNFHVVICDPRDVYQSAKPVANVHYSKQMPDDVINEIPNKKRTAIVALAHDPRQDDLALTAALESDAFYIGALGSKKSADSRLQRLKTLGYSEQQLKRIHGPVGLNIGSKRPAEIAVSILAQITATKNGIFF